MRRGAIGGLLAGALVTSLLAGCSGSASPGPPTPAGPEQAPAPTVASEREVRQLLDRRERAIVGGRRTAFTDTTAPGPGRRAQLAVFDVLDDLPVARTSYVVSSIDRVDDTDVTRVAALMLVRLQGFEPQPVAATHVLDLVRRPSGWRVRRDRLAPSGLIASPWELEGARIRTAEGVALVLDQQSRDQGDRLVRLFQEARTTTRSYVPYPFPQDVLVLAPSTTRVLRDAGFQPVEIQRTGGIVRGVEDRTGDVVAARMVLVPETLRQDDAELRNVLRHELAHMAIGQRDSDLPLWIVEGLAEWASWRGDVSFRISTAAVQAAEAGAGITEMPSDIDFRSQDSGTAYGIAWFAMRWLEQQHGAGAPYALLDRLGRERASGEPEVSRILQREYGVTSDELAARAGDLIAATFE